MPFPRTLGNTQHRKTAAGKASASRTPSIADAMRDAITAVNPGVVPVLLLDPSLALHARAAIEVLMLAGKNIADLPMPRVAAVTALYGGGSRDADFAQTLARMDGRPRTTSERLHIVTLADCRNINALSDEGVHILLSNVGEGQCVTAQQLVSNKPDTDIVDALLRLNEGARDKNAVIMLFLHCATGFEALWLQDYCRELIVVERCEAGPGASIAFSIAAMSLENQHADGIGKKMCEVIQQHSRWSRRYSTFVAVSAQDRAMRYMRQEGDRLEDIADLMDMHKSTVMRRLNDLSLSPDLKFELPGGWRDEWLSLLGIDVDDEDADDDGEDSDDLDGERGAPDEAPEDDDVIEEWDDARPASAIRKRRF
ncbi:hypothetical protein [Paraburkholderia dilworthii]|uniref:hypothetical protein n=1 Tax=Paraburkholderia dilworthii TaxID=948106 RepID=UPI0012690F3A|nr:hypothetical protein [Paraburkholderia dilworthii]